MIPTNIRAGPNSGPALFVSAPTPNWGPTTGPEGGWIGAAGGRAALAGCSGTSGQRAGDGDHTADGKPVRRGDGDPDGVAPITITGTGSNTDPIPHAGGLWRVSWKADGTSNFIVHVHGQQGTGIVNVILPNPSSGEAPFNSGGGRFGLEVPGRPG